MSFVHFHHILEIVEDDHVVVLFYVVKRFQKFEVFCAPRVLDGVFVVVIEQNEFEVPIGFRHHEILNDRQRVHLTSSCPHGYFEIFKDVVEEHFKMRSSENVIVVFHLVLLVEFFGFLFVLLVFLKFFKGLRRYEGSVQIQNDEFVHARHCLVLDPFFLKLYFDLGKILVVQRSQNRTERGHACDGSQCELQVRVEQNGRRRCNGH